MSKPINPNKVVIFSGAGISAESGIQTFRDSNGLWNEHSIEDVATPGGWKRNPQLVLDFYNERSLNAANAKPNLAHEAVASLESKYEVIVVTQNVDDLHERAGSSKVIHLHGELSKARSTRDPNLITSIGSSPIRMGDLCSNGSQLRPHIVWFGEEVQNYDEASRHIKEAARFMVVGTSLTVHPAAGLIKKARFQADKVIVGLELDKRQFGFKFIRGTAENIVPTVSQIWLDGRTVSAVS